MTTATETNGTQRGRAVPALHQHTIADTGITVGIRKVSPMIKDDLDIVLRREFPEPRPPVIETELGKEENAADPDYQKALNRWTIEHMERLSERLLRVAIQRAIEVEVDHEAVDELRHQMRAVGVELDPDDKYVYVSRICCGTWDDLNELSNAVFRRSMPTVEAVEAHKATFQGGVQG